MRAVERAALALTLVAAALGPACQPKKPKTSAEIQLNERMAQVLLRDGRAVEAEKAFRELVKEDSKNPEVWGGLGVSLVMQARFKDALPPLDKAVQLAPENGSYRNNRGVAYMELGRYPEAQADFDAAESSQNPDDRLAATINLGRLRQRQGDFAAAEQEFTAALARDPRSFAALLGRGVVREAAGNLEGAAEDFLMAIKIDPLSSEANLRMGMCLTALRQTDLGKRYLQRAIDLDPAGDTGAKARLLLDGLTK